MLKLATFEGEKSLMPGNSANLESHRADGHNYGCSFIEFVAKAVYLVMTGSRNSLKVLGQPKSAIGRAISNLLSRVDTQCSVRRRASFRELSPPVGRFKFDPLT
jgi:hypothetical protein